METKQTVTKMSWVDITSQTIHFILSNLLWIVLIGGFVFFPYCFNEELLSYFGSGFYQENFTGILMLILIGIGLYPFFGIPIIYLMSSRIKGESSSIDQSIDLSIQRWISFILLDLIVSIVTVLCFLCLFIPGLIVMCATSVAFPAMLNEKLKPSAAFDRSCDLTKGHRMRIFGFIILSNLVYYIPGQLFLHYQIIQSLGPLCKAGLIAVISAPFRAFGSTMMTLLYFDLRQRKGEFSEMEEVATIAVSGD